jgi:hypothetical protein
LDISGVVPLMLVASEPAELKLSGFRQVDFLGSSGVP